MRNVFQPGKGVVAPHIVEFGLIHLARQPLAAVDADINPEGKPGLDAGVHEAEDRVDLIVIQVQALALAVMDFQFAGLPILGHLEGHAGVDAAQHADQSGADAVAGRNFASNVLFAIAGGVEIADLAAQALGWLQRGLFQVGGQFLAVSREVHVKDAAFPEVLLQTADVGEVA